MTRRDPRGVVHDPLLPAARHLVGPDAEDLLRVALQHVGGELRAVQPVQVQHRPGTDLVVRFEADVAWAGQAPRAETLLAAATTGGAPEGTLRLVADDLEAGVWRYPFDPYLPALVSAVTPSAGERLEVVAYRPTRRAVVRTTSSDGTVTYRKVVRPREAARIVDVHRRLRAGGLTVPAVLDADLEGGLLTLAELRGDNLRDRLLDHSTGWPAAAEVVRILTDLGTVDLGPDAPMASMGLGDATRSHAGALLAILADEGERLDRIVAAVGHLGLPRPADAVPVHGDLYEAQLIVGDGAVTGVLDLDDVHLGDPLDDAANLLAHLQILEPATRRQRERLRRYRQRIRAAALEALTPDRSQELDLRTGAVLVGLATGPYRAQRDRWQAEVRRRLAMADRLVAEPVHERSLSPASQQPHAALRG